MQTRPKWDVGPRSNGDTGRVLGPEQKLIVNLTRGNVVCEDVLVANRPRRRMRGLLGRHELPAGEGMLLHPAPSIHTAFMRFAFDAVFTDATLRVLKVVERLPPWRVASKRHAWAVLEIAEGEVRQRGIEIGDQLGVVEVTDELGAVPRKVAWLGGNWTSLAEDSDRKGVSDLATANGRSFATGSDPWVEVQPSGPHVLVIGADRRFRSVAAALLTRRGCAVTLGDGTRHIGELVSREEVDVVVLDAGLSLTEAAHAAAKVQALPSPVGVVVVGEETHHGLSTMPVLPKWGSFDGLYEAIEQARPRQARRAASGSHG